MLPLSVRLSRPPKGSGSSSGIAGTDWSRLVASSSVDRRSLPHGPQQLKNPGSTFTCIGRSRSGKGDDHRLEAPVTPVEPRCMPGCKRPHALARASGPDRARSIRLQVLATVYVAPSPHRRLDDATKPIESARVESERPSRHADQVASHRLPAAATKAVQGNRSWQRRLAEAGYTVLTIDFAGYGESDDPYQIGSPSSLDGSKELRAALSPCRWKR